MSYKRRWKYRMSRYSDYLRYVNLQKKYGGKIVKYSTWERANR